MNRQIETIIIGGGQAGLATSFHLLQRGREHIILEKADQAGNAWRNGRWDSFTLLTPNWSIRIPGAEYKGDAPDVFMERNEIVSYFERYVEHFNLPVHYGIRVTSVEKIADKHGYLVRSDEDTWEAQNVVIATGLFQQPKIPSFSNDLPSTITQIPSGSYRNPQSIPPGAVMVVGSAQSGCQIAEELYQAGRKVYLSTGKAGRVPRRYRGKDIFEWFQLTGFLDRTVDMLPSSEAKFSGSLHVSSKGGGHALNLHQFSHDGVTLLGRLQGVHGERIWLEKNLKYNLTRADQSEVEITRMVDFYISNNGLDTPAEELPQLRNGYYQEEISELDLQDAGITTCIWSMGYRFDFKLVKLPILDGDGYPVQKTRRNRLPGIIFRGITLVV